jgi:spore coat protein H
MQTIPNLPSLRTQFVHLYLDNQDYGFYTHVENVGKEYLLRRGYHKNSNIYKAYHFDFKLSPKIAIDKKGKPLDQKAFDYVLEQKRGKNSKKLHKMLEAVNDYSNDFKKDVLEKYFNLNNFLTWEAVNILMGNTDVATSNFYIFNPKGEDTFYFLPWDYDSTWGYDWHPTIVEGEWTPAKRYQGPHNLWATEFGKRFLMEKGSLELLKKAVKEIKDDYLTPNKVKALTDSYYTLVYPRITLEPDVNELDSNQPTEELVFAQYNKIYAELAGTVEINYQRFLKELNSPMPFHIKKPQLKGENIVFEWEKAVDLQGDAVTYDLEVSESFRFEPESIKMVVKDLQTNSYSTKWKLPDGDYYYRVIARDVTNPTEYWQGAFEEEYDRPSDYTAYGVTDFTIEHEEEEEE